MTTRACTKCGEVKPLEAFSPDKRVRDGRKSACRACANMAYRVYHEANSERASARVRAWRAANPEKFKAYRRARNAANPERNRAGVRAWAKANPDKVRALLASRRARKLSAPVVERIYRAKVWERDGGRCHICGKKVDPANWHLEHIVPLALGGEHSYRNVAVAHPACNLSKGVRGPAQLRLAVGDPVSYGEF